MSASGEQCFSGGVDGTIQSWNTPNPNIDPYDSYGTARRLRSHGLRVYVVLGLFSFLSRSSLCNADIVERVGMKRYDSRVRGQ